VSTHLSTVFPNQQHATQHCTVPTAARGIAVGREADMPAMPSHADSSKIVTYRRNPEHSDLLNFQASSAGDPYSFTPGAQHFIRRRLNSVANQHGTCCCRPSCSYTRYSTNCKLSGSATNNTAGPNSKFHTRHHSLVLPLHVAFRASGNVTSLKSSKISTLLVTYTIVKNGTMVAIFQRTTHFRRLR
jgi:hypothetical protein